MIKTKLKNYRNRFNLNQMILNKKNNNKRKQENKLNQLKIRKKLNLDYH